MLARDILSQKNVLADVRASGKQQILSYLSKHAAITCNAAAEVILAAILHREELGSTGMGGGFAIPHARLAQIARPLGVFARVKPAIPFEAVDDQPVDLIFLLLLPAESNAENLNALTCTARRLRDPVVAIALRRAGNAKELYEAFVAVNPLA